jgi:hypothetical protein
MIEKDLVSQNEIFKEIEVERYWNYLIKHSNKINRIRKWEIDRWNFNNDDVKWIYVRFDLTV